jgi:hypothetical protein
MSQGTQGLDIQNVSGANYRQYVNEALKQVATMSSGATAPSNPQQQQFWFDTNNSRVKIYLGTAWTPFLSAANNTALGINALADNNSGINNTALGYAALQFNTTGANNTGIGTSALQFNTTGYTNTALGYAALQSNTTGHTNTALGTSALQSNTTGYTNTALGTSALQSNTTGHTNTALGNAALQFNTTGYSNTAVGQGALQSNTTGYTNEALGINALYSNTTGANNTALGYTALQANTTGYNNAAVGQLTLQANTTGHTNTAVGNAALQSNTTGYRNAALGQGALQSNTTGYTNTALGYTALQSNTTGVNNTAVGYAAGSGYGITITTQSNHFILGNSDVTNLICADTSISGHSDARDKKDIEALNFSGLAYINALIPRKFTWDMRKCVGTKKDITEIGFIAQEVESVQSSVYAVPGIVLTYDIDYTDPETDETIVTDQKLIAPAKLIPILVKAIQELTVRVELLETALQAQ